MAPHDRQWRLLEHDGRVRCGRDCGDGKGRSSAVLAKGIYRAGSTKTTANLERRTHRSGGRVQEGDEERGRGAAEESRTSRREGTGLATDRSGCARIFPGGRSGLAGADQRGLAKGRGEIGRSNSKRTFRRLLVER